MNKAITNKVKIGKFEIAEDSPAFIIAEAGVNHNGDIKLAKQLVDAAKEAGADCVKFQTFKAKNLVTSKAPKAPYQLKTTNASESQTEMLRKLELGRAEHLELVKYCKERGILFLSTPYNLEDIKLLEELGVEAYKVASALVVELPFLRAMARTKKPIILSTGMATLADVDAAVSAIKAEGNQDIVILQCTTNYPSIIEDANVRALLTMREAFKCPVGYSDHTENNISLLGSVALGATVVEKHFTLDKHMEGPDHSSSLTPSGFKEMVDQVRMLERALGHGMKVPSENELKNLRQMRRSLVAVVDIPQGTTIQAEMLGVKRPATGLHPNRWEEVIGRPARVDISEDTILSEGMVDWA